MQTSFLLLAQYEGLAVIPVATVVRDYFPHLSPGVFLRKVAIGDIPLTVIRIEPNTQKSARGVHLSDLAHYIDQRRAAAVKEAAQLTGSTSTRDLQPNSGR